jgi:uncharacterized protein YndB with AHSA1/START domain
MVEIKHSIQIDAPPATVYPLVATARGLARWWAADVKPVTGAAAGVELGFFNRQTIYRLRPHTFLPPLQAAWACESGKEWSGTQVIFLIAPQGTGTLLHFAHGGWKEETDYFTSCNTVWGGLLFRLKAVAEGHAVGPLFTVDGTAY